MKSPEEMPRLLEESSEIGGELKLGLERLSSNLPSPEQLASLAARLDMAPTGGDVQPNGGASNGHAPVSKTLLKIAAGAGISGAVLWGLLRGGAPVPADPSSASVPPSPTASSHQERPAPVAPGPQVSNEHSPAAPGTPRGAAAPAAPGESAPPDLRAPSPESPTLSAPNNPATIEKPRPRAPAEASTEREVPKVPSRPGTATPTEVSPAPARAPAASAPSETALLRDARLALSSDPARALALTEQHRRDYPSGGFAQEREVIAITALARLGRASEARSRADRFRNAYPTSPYIERVNRAVPP